MSYHLFQFQPDCCVSRKRKHGRPVFINIKRNCNRRSSWYPVRCTIHGNREDSQWLQTHTRDSQQRSECRRSLCRGLTSQG